MLCIQFIGIQFNVCFTFQFYYIVFNEWGTIPHMLLAAELGTVVAWATFNAEGSE